MDPKLEARRRSGVAIAIIPISVFVLGLALRTDGNLRRPGKSDPGPQIEMDSQVASIFNHSCADCHTNRTVWPWYSYLPPASWLIERDVKKGRQHFNVSTWSQYSLEEKRDILADVATVIANEEMPVKQYLILHKAARLKPDDAQALIRWASEQRRNLRKTSGEVSSETNSPGSSSDSATR